MSERGWNRSFISSAELLGPQVTTRSRTRGLTAKINKMHFEAQASMHKVGFPIHFFFPSLFSPSKQVTHRDSSDLVVLTLDLLRVPHPRWRLRDVIKAGCFYLLETLQENPNRPHISSALVCFFNRVFQDFVLYIGGVSLLWPQGGFSTRLHVYIIRERPIGSGCKHTPPQERAVVTALNWKSDCCCCCCYCSLSLLFWYFTSGAICEIHRLHQTRTQSIWCFNILLVVSCLPF